MRAHPQFHLHAQASGRWSTVNPPLATLPRDGSLDALFVPEPGEAWIEADMDQVELRIIAAEADETRMLEAFAKAWDIHTMNTCAIFGLPMPPDRAHPHASPANAAWRAEVGWRGKADERRTFGKIFTHRCDYLGDPKTCMDIPGACRLGLTPAKLLDAADAYFRQYPALRMYHRRMTERYLRTREARTFRGRRRRGSSEGMTLVRELMNHPFQGGVVDMMEETTLEIWRRLRLRGGRFVCQRHDAVTWGVPEREVPWARSVVEEVWTRPWPIHGYAVVVPVSWKA